jgi:sugar lactone lactonase YvrE
LRPTTLRRSVAAVTVAVGLLALANPAGASSAPGPQLGVVAGTGTAGPPTPGPATSSELDFPDGLTVDALGNLFVADAGNYEVDRISSAGVLSVVAGTGTSGAPTPGPASGSQVGLPYGLAVDRLGDVWVADANNNEVEKISPAGVLSIVAGTGTGGRPTAGPATRSDLDFPTGVAVDALGDLFIADSMNNEIEKVTPAGTLSVVAGTGRMGAPTPGAARSSDLDVPYGVTVDGAGDVVIADTFDHEVESVTPSGALSIVAGTGTSGPPTPGPATGSELGQPTAVGVDGLGTRYVADFADNDVDRVTSPSGGGQTVGLAAPGSGGLGPRLQLRDDVLRVAVRLAADVARRRAGGDLERRVRGRDGLGPRLRLWDDVPRVAERAAGLARRRVGGDPERRVRGRDGLGPRLRLWDGVPRVAVLAPPDVTRRRDRHHGRRGLRGGHGRRVGLRLRDHVPRSPKSTGTTLTSPVVGIATTGTGYVVATADGHVYAYGTPSEGSPAQSHVTLTSPIVAVTSTADGYTLATAAGTLYAYTS